MIDNDEIVKEFRKKYGKLDKEHKGTVASNKGIKRKALIGLVLTFIGFIIAMNNESTLPVEVILLVGIGLGLVLVSILEHLESYKKNSNYEEIYYKNISYFMLSKYFSDVIVYPDDPFGAADLFNNVKFRKYGVRVKHHRSFSFKYKDYDIKAMDIYADIPGDDDTPSVKVFGGLLNQVSLNRDFGTRMSITFNLDSFGAMGCSEKVEMDSSDFEKTFNVYADDKVKAMQLLTSDVMRKLIDLFDFSDDGFDLLIDHRTLYIRVGLRESMFQMRDDLADKDEISRNNKVLYVIKEIIDILKTNDMF